jgi:membrane-bound lytic murein transglycosylase D
MGFPQTKVNMSSTVILCILLAVFFPWASVTASSLTQLPERSQEAKAGSNNLTEEVSGAEPTDTLRSHEDENKETEETAKTDTNPVTQSLLGPQKQTPLAQQAEPGAEEISEAKPEDTLQSYEDVKFNIKRNSKVERYIRRFSGKGKENFAVILRRSGKYLPDIRETLRSEGVPQEIAYLPIIESGFNPRAVSKKNAVGLWQFIRPTGLKYGLKINYWVDERMHAEKSTLAAARYLSKLFDEFGSWELALAAYNCGEKRVARAIKRTGSTDFWTVSRRLPRETRNYVPKFNAALIIAQNPEKYGFRITETGKDYEAVSVPPRKSLAEIANLLDMGYKEISKYNPSLVGLSTPPGKSYELKVPKGYGEKLLAVKSEVETLKNVQTPFRTKPVRYRVRPDDSLWKIARKFGTSVEKLKYANNLSSSIIRPGQRLKIPTRGNVIYVKHRIRPGENIYVLAKKYGTSIDEIKRANNLKGSLIIAGETLSIPQRLSYTYVPRDVPKKVHHKIIPGDTLSELALRYRVSVSQIKRWNNMSSTTLIAGRNLVIYK